MKTSLLYGALHSLYNQFGNFISIKIFNFLNIHSHDRMSSTTCVHTRTWDYFNKSILVPHRFVHSPKLVMEEIVTNVNDLVQEFWTSSNGAVASGASLIAMRRLYEVLLEYYNVCFDISVFATAVDSDLADNNLQTSSDHLYSRRYRVQSLDDRTLFDGYQKMIDQSFSKSKDLGDMLKFLPGVVVQKKLSMQGMIGLYRIKADFLERLIKSIEPLTPDLSHRYTLDDYLSGFLQDRDRSQLYYCDPELQHISICRQILSLSYQSNVFDLQT